MIAISWSHLAISWFTSHHVLKTCLTTSNWYDQLLAACLLLVQVGLPANDHLRLPRNQHVPKYCYHFKIGSPVGLMNLANLLL